MEVKTLVSAPVKHKNEDYSTVLRVRNLKYKEADQYYWQVGTIKATQGWIIHVSVMTRADAILSHNFIIASAPEKI